MDKNRLVIRGYLTALVVAALFAILAIGPSTLLADGKKKGHTLFVPYISQRGKPTAANTDAVAMVNQIRSSAGVSQVSDLSALNNNCFEHARYMAENNILSHEQDPDMPFSSKGGQQCARNSNAWLGSTRSGSDWAPGDSIEGWMYSIAHRLWLLYPTTEAVGYGFFSTEDEHRAAAALDILTYSNFNADEAYEGWPVRYPQDNSYVPTSRFPITLNWRYFGAKPQLESTRLQTANGRTIAHTADTNLPGGHKGIQIIPRENLPANNQFAVTVVGSYDGRPFVFTWTFHTGN